MTPLSKRSTKLRFLTDDSVRECGRNRQVIVEAHPGYAVVRLQGLRSDFSVSWASLYSLAVKQALAEQLAVKKAAKKKEGK